MLEYGARLADCTDTAPVLVFVTVTAYVGQFADDGSTGSVPLVHAAASPDPSPLGGRVNVGCAADASDNAVVRPPVCTHE